MGAPEFAARCYEEKVILGVKDKINWNQEGGSWEGSKHEVSVSSERTASQHL